MLLKAANLSTRAGVARYLRAIGLDPRGFVIQRGARNYAGPSCPGAGWACTSTAHPVVQIAAAGGKNTFLCTTGNCAVVQTTRSGTATKTTGPLSAAAAPNKATCIKTTGLGQSCSINQKGATANMAIVYENVPKTTGLTQTASQTAQITQQATAGNSNTACVFQAASIDGSTNASGKKGTPLTVTLNAHQSASITQDAHAGDNMLQSATAVGACAGSSLTQNQTLTSTATGSSSITQNENAADSGPNISLDIKQNQTPGYFEDAATTGLNKAAFSQTNVLTAIANTPGPMVSQTQSSPSGGISANVNQFSHGISTADATQTETQCEDAAASGLTACSTAQDPPAYSLTQVQYGPVKNAGSKSPTAASRSLAVVRKDPGSIQSGNSGNTFTINQTSTQHNDAGQNQPNVVQGACSTSGDCTVTQNTNGTTNVQSGSDVNTTTTCSEGTCTPSSDTTGSISVSPTTITASNVDVGEFGVGGMRGGAGTGSIAVSGITAPVVGAFLYWNGPTNSSDPGANASVTFNGSGVTGTNIGFASDNNWGFQNTQSYRADVTSMITGNGSYSLANFTTLPDVDINGVSLIVFYNDANSGNDRNVVLWNGNDSNALPGPSYGTDGWDETLTNVPYPGSGSASLDLVVADGQTLTDDAVKLNDTTISSGSAIFQGDSVPPNTVDGLWDVKSFDITSVLTSGTNNLHLTTGVVTDYLSLVVAIANVPASAPVIG